MKKAILIPIFLMLMSCVSIPNETITLSKTLGKDLKELKKSHVNTINIYYNGIESKTNRFIDEVYGPFIIRYVLEAEFENYENNDESIITYLKNASQPDAGKEETDKAIQGMVDFQKKATKLIAQKRKEVLQPIQEEKRKLLKTINQSYDNAISANATLTGYLESVKDVKDAQTEGLSILGVEREKIDETMLKASDKLDQAIIQGKKIDNTSEKARKKINELLDKIKNITND